jgi:hypothetical protein
LTFLSSFISFFGAHSLRRAINVGFDARRLRFYARPLRFFLHRLGLYVRTFRLYAHRLRILDHYCRNLVYRPMLALCTKSLIHHGRLTRIVRLIVDLRQDSGGSVIP